jgi:HSP20 family protein
MTSWNPLQDLMLLQDRMNQLFEDATQRRAQGTRGAQSGPEADAELERADWCPAADVYETDAKYTIAADLPGIDRNTLELTIDDNRLIIRGNRPVEATQAARSERPGGTFLQTFSLPGSVDQSGIHADYKDGVLQVHLPKQKNQGQRVEIKVT